MFAGKQLEFGATRTKVVLRKTSQNQNIMDKFLDGAKRKNKAVLKYSLETKNGGNVKIGELNSKQFESAPNKGDVAEGIFSAAIFARFESKSKKITPSDVKAVLRRCKSALKVSGKIGKIYLKDKSANQNGVVDDTISLSIILAATNAVSLVDETFWPEFSELFSASVKYANRNVVKEWADLLYFNNQRNTIEVISDGVDDQASSKVDVHVKIDGKRVNINVSLKVNDVRQFGQIGGIDWEKLSKAWGALGVDISPIKKPFFENLANKDVIGALREIYQFTANKAKIDADRLKEFILFNATLNSDDVTLVNLSKQVVVYNFKKLKDAEIKKVTVKKVNDSGGKPTLVFYADGLEVIQLRMKIDNKPTSKYRVYVRTLVEKLDGLKMLIGEEL